MILIKAKYCQVRFQSTGLTPLQVNTLIPRGLVHFYRTGILESAVLECTQPQPQDQHASPAPSRGTTPFLSETPVLSGFGQYVYHSPTTRKKSYYELVNTTSLIIGLVYVSHQISFKPSTQTFACSCWLSSQHWCSQPPFGSINWRDWLPKTFPVSNSPIDITQSGQ